MYRLGIQPYRSFGPRRIACLLAWAAVAVAWGGAARGAEPEEELVPEEKVERYSVHGYADFQFGADSREDSGSFIQNELSLFLRAQSPDERWTLFSELEFDRIDGEDFLPDRGGDSVEVEFETAWAEFRHSDRLKIRGGKLLLPQHWQTFHYPNLTMSTLAPLMSGNVFPKSINAVQASGDRWNGDDRGVGYAVFVGHGGDTARVELEQNDGFAVGGRLTLRLAGANGPAWLDTFDFSISGLASDDSHGRDEFVMGFDTQIRAGRLEILSELAAGTEARDRGDLRARLRGASGDTLGFYLQAAWRVAPKWHLFYRYDYLDLNDEAEAERDESRHTFGVNFRPRPPISLKLEAFHSNPEGNREDYEGIAGSIVVNF